MIIYALIVGFVITIQAGLNKILSNTWGLASTLVWGSFVVLVASIVFYYGVRFQWMDVPEFMFDKAPFQKWYWWILIPGICGFIIILGLPWLIAEIGATKTIVLAIAGQIISSLLWDWLVEKMPINTWRIVGSLVTFLGAILVSYN